MVLDSGLDNACTLDAGTLGTGGTAAFNALPFCKFIMYAAFGTGSSTPDPSDTTLDAQVGSRTFNRGGFNNSVDGGFDSGAGIVWYEATFYRAFSITGNVNATEWGLAPDASGALSVRGLFRADPNDDQSSPIPLTLEDGDQLQLVITFRVQAAWEYESKSFVITGTTGNDTNGTHTGNASCTGGNTLTTQRARDTLQVAWPGGQASSSALRYGYVGATMSDQSGVGIADDLDTAPDRAPLSAAGYIPGDFYTDSTGTLGTSAANGDIYALTVGSAANTTGGAGQDSTNTGLRFILTDPPLLTKTSTHRLTLTLRRSIARL